MKRINTRSISQVMQDFLESEQLTEGMLQSRIVEAFESITEEKFKMKTCRNVYIKDGKLYATAQSSVLKYTMNLEKANLLKSLNERIEQNIVSEIVIR